MLRIHGPKSFASGLFFIVLALIFGISASGLNLGTASRMGPGYFPLLAAIVLGLLGLIVAAEGLFRSDERPVGTSLRGVLLVAGSVLAFAASVESLGLIIAVATTSFLLSLADRGFRLVPALCTSAVLAAFSWIVFTEGLSMPWPAIGYMLR